MHREQFIEYMQSQGAPKTALSWYHGTGGVTVFRHADIQCHWQTWSKAIDTAHRMNRAAFEQKP
jgi:hypothetical protein